MIYLNTISERQVVYMPIQREREGNLSLSLKSTINQSVHEIPDVTEERFIHFVQLSFGLPVDMDAGEYEYTLIDDAGIISTGLMIVETLSCPTEYNKAIQYEQYR